MQQPSVALPPSSEPAMSIIIVESLPLLRDSLVIGLSAWPHGSVCGAPTLAGAEAMLTAAPAVLLLDLALAGPEPAATLFRLRQAWPGARIVALAPAFTPESALLLLAAGAAGVVPRSAGLDDVRRALDTVRHGAIHLPASIPRQPLPNGIARLTRRQRDVLNLLAEGRSTKDIARTLDLAVSTIKVHLAAVYRTFGARNRVEALCRAGALR